MLIVLAYPTPGVVKPRRPATQQERPTIPSHLPPVKVVHSKSPGPHHRGKIPSPASPAHEPVEPFHGRFARSRYAPARDRTSASSTMSSIRWLTPRSSSVLVRVRPGLAPSSISAQSIDFYSVTGWIS